MKKQSQLFVLGIALFYCLNLVTNSNTFSLATEKPLPTSNKVIHNSLDRHSLVAQNPSDVARFQTLAKADNLYLSGKTKEAETLYRQVKPNFPEAKSLTQEYIPPIYEVSELREKGQQLWQKAEDGIDKGLDSKAFFNLQTLTKLYPEFVPATITLAEFCLEKAEYCEKTAGEQYSSNPREIMEQLSNVYPDEPDIIKTKIDFLAKAGKEDYDNYLEASITAKQFALFFVDYPEALEFNQLADEYIAKYQSQLKTDLISNTVVCGVLGAVTDKLDKCGIISMMLQGESTFGSIASEQYVKQFQDQDKLLNNSEVNKYIKGLAGRITPYLGRDFDYEFYVVKDDSFNAFALPGGKIFINTGAIKQAKSEAELAGLIGHELAHAAFSHSYRRLAQSGLTGFVADYIPLGSLMSEIVNKQYSRDNERQSDILGTRVLAASGYAADGLRNMMLTLGGIDGEEALENLNSGNSKSQTNWRDTHPVALDRVRYLEKLIVDNGYNRYAYEGVTSHQNIKKLL